MHALVIFATVVASQAGPGYKRVGGNHGVDVSRKLATSAIDLVAEGDIEAPPALIRTILLDYPRAHSLSDHVTESKVLATKPEELTVYQHLKLPVVEDRDFTLKATWGEKGPNLWTRFVVDNADGPPVRKGIIRLSTMTGSWELQPIRGGTATHAIYRVQLDLAGTIPKSMVSGGAAKDLPKLFDGVRKEAVRRGAPAAASNTPPPKK